MSLRVGKKEAVGVTPLPTTVNESKWTRALASPWAILVVFPAIVFTVGSFLTLAGQSALRNSNTDMAKARLRDQAVLVAEHMDSALLAAEPMLEQLKGAVLATNADASPEVLGPVLRDLMRGRDGVSYVSASFPDGTFQGAYLDDDGAIRFQISRVGDGGTEKLVYDYQGHAKLSERSRETSDYDPRKRPFYGLATQGDGPVWTAPYAFAGSNYTGISRALAVYRDEQAAAPGPEKKQLHAVLTVDFDVARLSALLKRQQLDDVRALLIGQEGVLLADPRAHAEIERLRRPGEVLRFADLNDPVLDAFFSTPQAEKRGAHVSHFEAPGGAHLSAVAHVGSDRALGWRVAYLAPEASFLASLYAYSQKSWLIGGAALLLALLLSIGFARLVVGVRKEAAEARALAKKAQQRAEELGSYRLLQCLGKGGMGEVWLAEHRLLARQAAVKLIRSDDGEPPTPEAIERFRREAQSLAALRCDNTIELYDYGVTEDGTLFYVMELLDGLDLETLVLEEGPQPPARVIHLLQQACRSLAEAHDGGLVHRDIKPANLFVCRRADDLDLIKVLDFGLVRAVGSEEVQGALGAPDMLTSLEQLRALEAAEAAHRDSGALKGVSGPKLTRADHLMGTPEFMAPEQAIGADVDGRADLYALGALAFWLLTGLPLFRRDNVVQLLVAHMTEPPPNVAELCPEPLPEGFAELIERCLAKTPEERPASAREVLSALRALKIPPGQEWTDEKRSAWWKGHRPVKSSVAESATVAIDLKLQIALQSMPPKPP